MPLLLCSRFSLVSASSLVQYLDYFDNARAAQLLAVAIREPPLCVCVRACMNACACWKFWNMRKTEYRQPHATMRREYMISQEIS